MQFELTGIVVAALALALAGLVHGTLGIGFPMVATPLLALAMDVRTAVLVTLLPTIVVNLVTIVSSRQWRAAVLGYWPLAAWAAPAAMAGALLLSEFDPAPFKLALALVIFLYLYGERVPAGLGFVVTHPRLGMGVFGIVAGLCGGAVNVMVPILVMYALAREMPKNVLVSALNMCFLAGKMSQVLVFGGVGLLTAELVLWTGVGAALAAVALFVGFRLRRRITAELYTRLLRRLLAVMACVLIIEFVIEI